MTNQYAMFFVWNLHTASERAKQATPDDQEHAEFKEHCIVSFV